MQFGYGDPRPYTGLNPTLVTFMTSGGTAIVGPTLAEVGTSTGIYAFSLGTTIPMTFIADAATTSPGPQGRYVFGVCDPSDRIDEYAVTLTAMSSTMGAQLSTLVGQNTTLVVVVSGLGGVGSTFGGLTSDPIDLFGYVKRILENQEGNQQFIKQTGAYTILSRGSSSILAQKTIANSVSMVTRS